MNKLKTVIVHNRSILERLKTEASNLRIIFKIRRKITE